MVTEAEMHANYAHALRRVATMNEAGRVARMGPWWLIYSGLPGARQNVAVLEEPAVDVVEAMALAEVWFEQQGAEWLRLDLRGELDAPMLAAAEVSGYQRWSVEPAMSLDALPARWEGLPHLDVKRLESEADVRMYGAVESEEREDHWFQEKLTRAAMAEEGHVLLVGSVEGRPVARSMAVVLGEVVGVHNVYVPPSLRRRGYGAAITAATVEAGRALGATAACLEATPLGEPVYERMGFRRRYDYIKVGRRLGPR